MTGLDPVAVQLLTGGGTAGLIFGLVVTVWAFATRRVVSRGAFDDVVAERDRWLGLYEKERTRGDEAVDAVERLSEAVEAVVREREGRR